MDRPELPPTPSLKLTMVPSTHHASPSSSNDAQSQGSSMYGANARSSRELIYDQLRNMIAQEEKDGYKCCDYLSYYSVHPKKPRKASKNIDEGCRTSICGWMYRVADHFDIDREVVSIALSYIDRILSMNYCSDRRTFKLISATSLHLAIKVHFPHMWRDVGSLLPELSRCDFALDDLVGMEKELVQSLTWLMNPATVQSILMNILALLPSSPSRSSLNSVADMALFFAELSVCDYFFVTSRKSIIAIAAVLNASESAGFIPFEPTQGQLEVSYQNDRYANLEKFFSDIGYLIDWHEISFARDRLWSLYRQSSEYVPQRDMISPPPLEKSFHNLSTQENLQHFPSPTYVVP